MAKTTKSEKSKVITGDISINTENILPIIKKWLYSEHEIFLRELASNAFDAITKLQKISNIENLPIKGFNGKIQIDVDEKAKTLTITDNGIGMDADEIQKYINQIAFSGAEDFIKKYKDKDEKSQIIGHFGLGFYSAFMVSEKVEIHSLSYKKGAKAIHWKCDGSTKFSIDASDKKEVGTSIVLFIDEENKQFLNEGRIKELVKKFANFLPVEIKVGDAVENDQNPLWIEQPASCKDEDYKEFYTKLYPYQAEPLFWIHLNVDYPFNLKGILYFPKLMHEMDQTKGEIKLFCKQVFVTDNAKDIVPEFLTLLRGAIDCPEIPLNVSRSYLQNDPYVQKISKHIVKKVADKLNELFKKDRESFEKYWEDIHPFIKYGMMHSDDFYKKVKDIVIFKSSADKNTTIQEYLERNKEKVEKTVLYCTDKESQASYVDLCQSQGLEVIYLASVIDSHFVQFLESKDTDIKYKAIDTDLSEHLVDEPKKEGESEDQPVDAGNTKIEEVFKTAINNDKLKIEVKKLKTESVPAIILESEQMKRLKTMSAFMKGDMGGMQLDDLTLVVNSNSPVITNIINMSEKASAKDKVQALCQHVHDLALMSQRPLTGDQMQGFIKRSQSLLSDLAS